MSRFRTCFELFFNKINKFGTRLSCAPHLKQEVQKNVRYLTSQSRQLCAGNVLRKHTVIVQRFTSSSSDKNEKDKPPLLMQFDPVIRPEIFKTLRNWILTKVIIQPYLDGDFSLKDFTKGAKQALTLVSALLAQGDFEALKGLVINEAIDEVKKNYSLLNIKQRQELQVKPSDILFAFPYQVGIFFDDNANKRFAEITVVYHCLNGLEDLKNLDKKIVKSTREEITICNYRFIREYTKGVQSDWTINRIGHFKIIHLEE